MKKPSTDMNRRQFLGLTALGLTGLTVLPSWKIDGVRIAPSDRIVMGFIGVGQQGCSDFKSHVSCPGVQVAACSDVDSMKITRFRRRVMAWQASKDMNQRCDGYEFFEDLLERKDIDAVSIATPDHWHALAAIYACQSGKDVYCQKPLAYTITEGYAMVRAARENKRIFEIGSQQRSSKEFQKAIEIIRSNKLGHVLTIWSKVGDPPTPLSLPEMPVPANLNFNQWMGPLTDPKIHYHPDLCPPIELDPEKNEQLWGAWRWYSETGNGYTADWGAHMFDIAQAAVGMDGIQPVEYIPIGYNGTKYSTMKYANGIVMTEQPYLEDQPNAQGIRFNCTNGWLEVARGYLACSDSSLVPEELAGTRPGSPKKNTATAKGVYEVSSPHSLDFINCIRSRKDPIAPVEIAASSNTLCCLVNIAHELHRPVKWNPATLQFEGDDKEAAAHRLYWYEYRNPYKLPYCDKRC